MRYKILGTTEATTDEGTPLRLGGPRLRALLTTLTLHPNRTVPTPTLITEIWPTDTPRSPAEPPAPADPPAALQALIARLRRTLGKDAITSEPGGYRLTAGPSDIDLFVFDTLAREGITALNAGDPATAARTLREALSLWRGPALADLPDRTAATRPEAQRAEATRARIDADLRLGRAADLVPELRELTDVNPYDEPLHALLIRALRATGRTADALTAYEHVRRTFADGLGTDPGPELQALYAELLNPNAGEERAEPARRPEPGRPDPGRPEPGERNGNIRPRLTSFVGREPELDAIRSDIQRARLVTLTGPGGSGKTRLAEEAAAGHPQAWLAELAPLDRPEAVPGAVVSALGLRETVLMTSELTVPQDDPVALLVEYCAPRSLLLLLDNCEHVIGAAAELAETLLTRCPGLTVLATSREPLGVPGESVRPVEPLPPDPAHRLFTERAQAVSPGFDLTREADAVAEICRRLDGLPLAIELAAARLRLLTPRQIADRLDDRFRLLTGGSRTALPRQQTLRAVVDWSWDLLDDRERGVLCQASVFAGGWDIGAAESVCGPSAADLIGALVDKSLVVATPGDPAAGDGMRYRMLETIHEYATERAAEAPELLAAAEQRHSAWVRALVEEAEPLLRSAAQLPWIRRLETEMDNIRAALDRALTARDEEQAAALALATGWFWWLRNYRREGIEWTDAILGLNADHSDLRDEAESAPTFWPRMNVLLLHLFLLSETVAMDAYGDDEGKARATIARVGQVFSRPGPAGARFPGLVWPFAALYLDAPGEVRPLLDVAVDNCRRYGGDWEVGVTLMFRTHVAVDSPGGLHGVDDDLAELRMLSRRCGDRWMRAQVASAAGEAAMARGRFDDAKEEYEEALRLAYEVGAYAEAPFLIARIAEIAYRVGDRPTAAKALEEASTIADRYGVMDARAFVYMMRARIALDGGEVAGARELVDAAHQEARRGTPPPQFDAGLAGIEARVTAAESGPRAALPLLTAGLKEAVNGGCSELVTATMVDFGALLLGGLGDHPRAVRLLAAAETLRGDLPNPQPERAEAESVARDARAALGTARYTEEHTAGVPLGVDDVLTELTESLSEQPSAAGEP
ncbi:BTAD domain-containing putative transcriptional regulator [Streptomyces sp. NPDC058001]|uniref:AfsR/SARP family transcriptional regulator n=1 Tax=Streptomyces sp. NPDC058001 TaxID=3346300 RepID=UPI0036E193DC